MEELFSMFKDIFPQGFKDPRWEKLCILLGTKPQNEIKIINSKTGLVVQLANNTVAKLTFDLKEAAIANKLKSKNKIIFEVYHVFKIINKENNQTAYCIVQEALQNLVDSNTRMDSFVRCTPRKWYEIEDFKTFLIENMKKSFNIELEENDQGLVSYLDWLNELENHLKSLGIKCDFLDQRNIKTRNGNQMLLVNGNYSFEEFKLTQINFSPEHVVALLQAGKDSLI